MNLIDLITRKDRYLLKAESDLQIGNVEWMGLLWRCLHISRSHQPQLILQNILSHHSMKSMPANIGWYVATAGKCTTGKLIVTVYSANTKCESVIDITNHPVPVNIPWQGIVIEKNEPLFLSLYFLLDQGGTANLLVHQRLERKSLIKFATGRGVEIGPGPKPQIIPSNGIDVEYVEESPIEKWVEAYDPKGKYGALSADFSKYTIGTAWNLPQADNSLDFIFSSHVFEHLANPIGHLLRWKSKLKPGGKILAVVPDLTGTKDYRAAPSTIVEILDELRAGLVAPTRQHYLRWAEMKNQASRVDELISHGVSIHVHFYTAQSMALLLDKCINEHGFQSYSIQHRQNHKDFYFTLQ
ncbi:MAG: methyltransferase domain-containing protein [Methylomonas sp.]|nr:methyltransferase domain-containing protein [Methylomonas sp.]